MDNRAKFKKLLHLSTIGSDSVDYSRSLGLGLEIADYCWAYFLDNDLKKHEAETREKMRGINTFWFHAPFAEISPCAIDPKVRELTALRYKASIKLAEKLGIRRIVIHSGYVPHVYFPEYFVSETIEFYKAFLKTVPENTEIALENVMDPAPDMIMDIIKGVDDKRLGMCLDIGHANCEVSEEKPMKWLEASLPYLKHIHIHNNDGKNDTHSSLGDGTIPMEQVLDTVLKADRGITFTLENQHCERSIEWLSSRGYL